MNLGDISERASYQVFMEQCASAIAASYIFFQDWFADVLAALFALIELCL